MRLDNWPSLLNAAIETASERPFSWGSHDCCLFAADCALAITGVDAASDLRGTYSSEETAAIIISDAGGFEALVTSLALAVGWRRSSAKHASRGDLVSYTELGSSPALGICNGANCAFLTKKGIAYIPLSKCSIAWRVN